MYNKALIILSFVEKIDVSHLNAISSISDYIICADGGVDIAKTYGIMPDCVIGDFDSTINSNRLDCLYITLPSEKDFTDTEAAINTLGNVGLLEKYLGKLDHLEFMDEKNSMQLLDGESCSTTILTPISNYRFFSLVSLDSAADGISITGAKYNLDNASISRASTLCISNEIILNQAHISVHKGKVLLMRSAD